MSRKRFQFCTTICFFLALGGMFLAACARSGTTQATTNQRAATPSASGRAGSTCATGIVHTLTSTFKETCVNVAKGSFLKVVPVAQSFHNLANGSWVNNTAKPAKEPGAPTIQNVQVTTSPVQIGPFTTAGTFHIYCTVHPGMNLTVIVK